MTFLNPLMLWGLAGMAVPLIIHLWGRRRPRRQPFPSIRLIRASKREQRGLSRIRQLLLLLLRMAMIALAALGLAQPIVRSTALAKLFPAQDRVAIVVDASASMGYRAADATLMDRAKQAVTTIRRNLPPGCRLTLLAADTALHRLNGRSANLENLAEEPFRGRIITLLNNTTSAAVWDRRTRLFIISDLQETTFRGRLTEPLPQPPVAVDVSAPDSANTAITDVKTDTACPLAGRPLQVSARVRTYGTMADADTIPLAAQVGNRHVPGRNLPADEGTVEAQLRIIPETGGTAVWRLSVPADKFPLDDVYFHTERVRDSLDAAIIVADSNPDLLATALNPGGDAETNIDVAIYHWRDLAGVLPEGDLLLLDGLPPGRTIREPMIDFIDSGGGAIVFAGPAAQVDNQALSRLLGASVRIGDAVASPEDAPLTLAHIDRHHPALRPFANPRAGNIFEFTFSRRREIQTADTARVIATFTDGAPAIIATNDPDRHFLLLNTSLDDRWTDAPYTAAYVPFIHHLCYDVTGPLPRTWIDWYAGEQMRVPVPDGARGAATITPPSGQQVQVQPDNGIWVFQPGQLGVHEVTWSGGPEPRKEKFAVNLNPAESDPAKIVRSDLAGALRAPDLEIIRPAELEQYMTGPFLSGANIAWPLLLLALIAFIAEIALGRPAATHQREGAR